MGRPRTKSAVADTFALSGAVVDEVFEKQDDPFEDDLAAESDPFEDDVMAGEDSFE